MEGRHFGFQPVAMGAIRCEPVKERRDGGGDGPVSRNRTESFSFSSSSSRSIAKLEDADEDEQMSVGSWSRHRILGWSEALHDER